MDNIHEELINAIWDAYIEHTRAIIGSGEAYLNLSEDAQIALAARSVALSADLTSMGVTCDEAMTRATFDDEHVRDSVRDDFMVATNG